MIERDTDEADFASPFAAAVASAVAGQCTPFCWSASALSSLSKRRVLGTDDDAAGREI
jgi:hypothetical protein